MLAAGAAATQALLQQYTPSLVYAEMLLEPWLVLQGLVPYRDFIQHHAPLVTYLLAGVLAVAPQTAATVVGLHVVLVAVLTGLVVLCGGAIGGPRVGAASGLSYLALHLPLDGALPWFEPFVAGVLLLLVPLLGASGVPSSGRAALVAGAVVGVGALMKQTGALALPAIGLCLLAGVRDGRLASGVAARRALATAAGFLLPLAAAALWFAANGALEPFVYQTVLSNARYVQLAVLPPEPSDLPALALLVSVLAAATLAALAGRASRGESPPLLVPLLGLVSLMTLYPRFAEFHYQQALPFIALSAGQLVGWATGGPTRPWLLHGVGARALLALVAAQVAGIGLIAGAYFARTLPAPPAAKAVEEPLDTGVVAWLQPRLVSRERLLVLGDTRLHLATDTLPASRLLYVFPWLYDGTVLLHDLERSRPRFVVRYPDVVDDDALAAHLARHYELVFATDDSEVLQRREP